MYINYYRTFMFGMKVLFHLNIDAYTGRHLQLG